MGSVFVDDVDAGPGLANGGDGTRCFKIAGLASLREDVLLSSWLIALIRTREDRSASFEWAYGNDDDNENGVEQQQRQQKEKHNQLSTDDVLPDLNLNKSVEEFTKAGTIHLQVQIEEGHRLAIRPVWYSDKVLPYTVERHIETLVDILRICISRPADVTIDSCMAPTPFDLDSIWRWCHELPPTHAFCMQDMVAHQAQRHPDKVAIDSWDGTLTYGEVDRYSTFLAASLVNDSGVQLHDFIPLCFEKSRWTIVAVLATMKAGATIVMMDPSLPLARLQNMAKQVDARTMISSRLQKDLAEEILPTGTRFVLEADAFARLSSADAHASSSIELPTVPPTALMYIIFTSGSTGTPKGVKISHQTYTSSAIPRARAVGYSEESRVLDFASYAFDVSIDSMLLTLGNGGCLCIPSDEDRLNDINGVMRNMRINYAGITPSVARILDQDVIASLSALGLGGEASAPRDVNLWGQDARIVIGYGPCECTIGCTVNSSAATGRDYISIGPGNGAAMWIVDPNDHNILLPVGAVGELLVEGPIVGQGYLNDPDKTAAAFIHDPPWLLAGHNGHPGRTGRLYKTGDLGMYDPDGSGDIVFAGRKDTQVKLRGQRVELGEIESQLKARLPSGTNVIAEVITPQASAGQPTLVAFVSHKAKVNGVEDLSAAELSDDLHGALAKVNADLGKVLPRYMVPNAYIPTNYIPTLISGKIDRKRLRQFGATVDLQKLDQTSSTTKAAREDRELNGLERRLRHAWSLVLKLDEDGIHPDDNFFALGGESVAAMRLVSACRERGLELSVTSTFGHPTLGAMAQTVRICEVDTRKETPPFSLISQSVESASAEAAQACGTDPAAVEDIYPCTPTQESLVTFSLKSSEPYVAQRIACVPSHLSLDALQQAWEAVVAANPILRTRVAQLQDPGLQQVVLKEKVHWRRSTDLARYLEEDRNERMDLGQSLARYAIVEDAKDGKRYMVWTVHHVQYDGWSEPLILDMVVEALKGQAVEAQAQTRAQMKNFVQWIRDTDEAAMQDFWRTELQDAMGPQFPRTPSRDFLPTPDAMVERQIRLDSVDGLPFTMATLIRGAWALVASQYSGSDDVIFGETLTGRDISLPAVEDILGPLNATIPIRIRLSKSSSVASYLQSVQHVMSSRIPYQHMGMQYIRRVSVDAQHACEAPTGLVIQPEPELVGGELGFELGDPVREALHFNPYPLMLAFGLRKGGFRVCASFDSSLVEVTQMERVLAQLETACVQLTQGLDRRIDEMSYLPQAELDQIWRWNQTPPLSLDESTGHLRADTSIKNGAEYPRIVVPWVVDPRNPSMLSPIGCPGELWLEGSCIPGGDAVDTPAWLAAGSSQCVGRAGKVRPTGDIVQLRPDGVLVFVGRKDDIVPVSGHAVNVADLEAHCARLLPPSVRAAAAVFETSVGDDAQKDQELVIFVEQQPQQPPSSAEESIEVMFMRHEVSCDESDPDSFTTSLSADVPISLAVALKKLDKFIRDDLPSSSVPSAYVVVDRLPLSNNNSNREVDRSVLKQLASKIPRHVLGQLREGFKKAWETDLVPGSLTAAEDILRSSWAQLLRMRPEQIDVDDNFFRLGGDSVLVMKLVSGLRAQGHGLTVADVFQHMRLGDAAKVLKVNAASTGKTLQYKPFSTLRGVPDVDHFLSEFVRPKLASSAWSIKDAAPVTDSQALDIRTTVDAPRTSVQYTMLYLGDDVEQERLLQACRNLVKAHDILRTVFIEHESTFLQVILDELDTPLITQQTDDEDLSQAVAAICTEDSESEIPLGAPFLKIFHVTDKNNSQQCLVLRLSHSQYDGMSLPRLLQDLESLYTGGKITTDFEHFPTYLARIKDERAQTKALSYWRNLLKDSTLSSLPGQSIKPGDRGVFREQAAIESFQPLEAITTANLLTAGWALVLARRLGIADVTFGGVTSGRSIDVNGAAGVENVIGPCYQLTPIRVSFVSGWTAADLLSFVQRQSAESAAYDFVGFETVARECAAQWLSPSTVRTFDSIVHHQDWDDTDSMPFAGGQAKLAISNPHGDSPQPLKVVSFVREGQLRVGVVGSERDLEFVEGVLGELVGAVRELVEGGDGQRILL
ncbi:hypothetical protein M406DRAFT_37645 [Cryphonectria parasitica EP155]|uniref:Carrier domain-containing protein n=1 Tax=Cryphonectria parasitica (strain ATCC 38755 / EP155) TaxID=660469 RepID=A0A9P5CNS2_CRYP1|nr:uncharacterized protein M406DRAFT_37645 [Cryphonectria parasitica EP155]KAF3765438.1 hypothetical protein M406DRAFT_37645 [Cryphonectria parasitica EP155]